MSTTTAPQGTLNAFGVDVSGKQFLKPPSRTTPGRSSFGTFLILCPTCFFLGILYSQFPYDYPILWAPPSSTPPTTPSPSNLTSTTLDAFSTLESHLRTLHSSPPLIPRILHIVIATGLLGFLLKLLRPTESNLLFDGSSLVLYLIGLTIYVSNIVKGLRLAASGQYTSPEDAIEHTTVLYAAEGTGIGREDSLRVLSASHTILALVLMGVLVLQAGQWYAERKEREEWEKVRDREREERRGRSSGTGGGAGDGKGEGKGEGKKQR